MRNKSVMLQLTILCMEERKRGVSFLIMPFEISKYKIDQIKWIRMLHKVGQAKFENYILSKWFMNMIFVDGVIKENT